jgi:hypothetical protein
MTLNLIIDCNIRRIAWHMKSHTVLACWHELNEYSHIHMNCAMIQVPYCMLLRPLIIILTPLFPSRSLSAPRHYSLTITRTGTLILTHSTRTSHYITLRNIILHGTIVDLEGKLYNDGHNQHDGKDSGSKQILIGTW